MGFRSIAIDGPAGAGKSTLARQVAAALGYLYVDTGAIYRTLGLAVLRHGVDPQNGAAVAALLQGCAIDLRHGGDGVQHMYLDGEDVSEAIRRPEISDYSSKVSAIPEVRSGLMEMQRSLARQHNVVMDGRDIGTVVLPDADVKIFLTASPEERARRRFEELVQRGTPQPYEEVLRDLKERDAKDTGRATAPLRRAEGAVEVDTTDCSLEESLDRLLKVAQTGVMA